MDFEAFAVAGLYDPGVPNAEERREFLQYLLDRGHSAEEIIQQHRDDAPVTDLLASLGHAHVVRLTAREVAERAGVETEDVEELRALLGLPITSLDSPEVPATYVDDVALFALAVATYGRERTFGFVRVIGAAVSALMEGGRELAWAPLQDRAMTELEVALANETAMQMWTVLPELLRHLMIERAGRDMWFEEQLRRGAVSMGVAFVDLVGSTEWTARLSASAHAAALSRFESEATRLASRHGCRVVKFIGDEAMLVGADAVGVAEAAASLCAAVASDPDLPAARGAAGWGNVTPRGGDYFGEIVNVVARASKESQAGAIVVTADVAERLDASRWRIGVPRLVDLRGVPAKVELVDVAPTDGYSTS